MTALLLALALPANAVPVELVHQGRLLDGGGAPLQGAHNIDVAIYDVASGGTALWTETQPTPFDDGHFTLDLGRDPLNPLDGVFDGGPRWIGISVDGATEFRKPIQSVPYAVRAGEAGVAGSVSGGVVDASEIRIGGTVVIDDTGALVGPGDGDTLAGLGCVAGQIALYDGVDWTCAANATVVDWSTVVNIPADIADGDDDTIVTWSTLTGIPVDLSDGTVSWAEISGVPADLLDGDDDTVVDWSTLNGIPADLLDGDDDTIVTWSTLSGIPGDFADGVDDVLSEAQVEAYIENGGLDLNGTLTAPDASFAGGVQLGDVTAACNAGTLGTMRWTGTSLDVCTASDWAVVWPSSPDGSGAASAARSCFQLLSDFPATPDGTYWIDPDGPSAIAPFQTRCDMTYQGGGWTMIGKGRQGWNWSNSGQGAITDLQNHTTNGVAYLPSATVDALVSNQDFDTLTDGLRIERDEISQEVVWTFSSLSQFSWLFDTSIPVNHNVVGTGAVNGTTRDIQVTGNDITRIFTWAWSGHSNVRGFSTGAAQCSGGWQAGSECHVIPHTRVWVRN